MEVEADETQNKSPQSAAISSFRYPLLFTGTNQLLDNVGGGLSVIGTTVRVDGSLIVHNNTASRGGGIRLKELCLVWPSLCVCLCVYVCVCVCVCVCSVCVCSINLHYALHVYINACMYVYVIWSRHNCKNVACNNYNITIPSGTIASQQNHMMHSTILHHFACFTCYAHLYC